MNIDSYHDIIVEIEDYAILLLDEAGTVKDWNKGAEKLKGYTVEEIIGKNFRLFYTEEDREKKLPEKLIEKAILNGKAIDEGWRVRKDGSKFWGSILITALRDGKNKLVGFLKITRDLTERKDAEEKLKGANERLELQVQERTQKIIADEKRFRDTLDNMLEGIQIHDFSWRYVYVNDALVKYSTYSKEELLGHTLMEKYPGIEQTDLFKTLERCMNERFAEQMETEFIFPNGSKADFQLSIQPTTEGIFILSVDITERKKAEEELLKTNRLYAFISAINQSIVHISDEQELLNNACRIAIEIGQFKMAWIGLLDETGKLNMISLLGDEHATQEVQKYSGLDYSSPQLRDTPTGKVLNTGHFAVSNDVQNDPVMRPWKEEYVRHGIKANISFPIKKFSKIIGVLGFNSAVEDFFDAQEISLLAEAAGDISFALENFEKEKLRQQVEEEIKHLNENLENRVKERTASLLEANQQLESFSYTVSHDLRSPLQVINGYASILAKKYTANMDDAAKELLQGIKDYTKKMARTMEDLLNFSRLGRAEVARSEVNMNDLVRVVVEELGAGSKDFSSDFDIKMLSPANCDKGLMHQVWTNLISNAVKYSKKEGASTFYHSEQKKHTLK